MQTRDTKKQQLWAVASIDREALQLLAAPLECAVDTLQHITAGTASQPAGTRSAWPEMICKSRFTVEQIRQESRALLSA
jgi:hypothetical protein